MKKKECPGKNNPIKYHYETSYMTAKLPVLLNENAVTL